MPITYRILMILLICRTLKAGIDILTVQTGAFSVGTETTEKKRKKKKHIKIKNIIFPLFLFKNNNNKKVSNQI